MTDSKKNRILVNSSPFERRVAVIEDGRLSRVQLEAEEQQRLVGNIYKGKVKRVLPGMNAAFVDIGLERAGFMHADDVAEYSSMVQDIDSDSQDKSTVSIDKLLQSGQELLVQIVKPPRGSKGARLTGQVSVPGRNMVLVPQGDSCGVSRKVRDPGERDRLRDLVREYGRSDVGYIVRTAAEGKSDAEIIADINYLGRLWDKLSAKQGRFTAPALLYKELDVALRMIRDALDSDLEEVWVDDEAEYSRVREYIEAVIPARVEDVHLYERTEAIFQGFGVEKQLDAALHRKVMLPSSGYLIIDETEALTTVDVNTGGFVGKKSLEDTVFKTNMEAVAEVAHQLRLRNVGGIVVIDFIDMIDRKNRQVVFDELKQELRKDFSKVNLTQISDLGLVEMTRQRVGPSLLQAMTHDCEVCRGTGHVLRTETILGQIYRTANRVCQQYPNQTIEIELHPTLADRIWEREIDWMQELETRHGTRLRLKFREGGNPDHFEVKPKGTAN